MFSFFHRKHKGIKLRGQYTYWHPETGKKIIVPNALMTDGFITLLKMLWQADTTVIAGGGSFYIGLKDNVFSVADTLTTMSGEPTVSNGYARIAVTRDATGFPTVEVLNGDGHVRSKVVTFTASGGNFSGVVQRLFLCSVSAGTTGKLFSESASFPNPITLLSGQSLPVQFDLFMN